MLVSELAYATSRALAPHGLYDGWLARRGEHLAHGADRALMERIHVREAMDARATAVGPGATLPMLVDATATARLLVLPVVDEDGALAGVIRQPDLRAALLDRGELAAVLVAADLAEPVETASPDASLRDALRAMNARALDALPVVDPRTGRYLGMLGRADLLAAYERGLLQEV
jgi:CBS domain-containing protein